MLQEDNPWHGYCLKEGKFGDMWDLGVFESVGNLKNILYDSISTGGMLLTTESVVSNKKNYKRKFFFWSQNC